ncbi:MAG: hypothetical protein RLZZ628_3160 [Bacteroidota bacterium]|jgi:hypothetical protein
MKTLLFLLPFLAMTVGENPNLASITKAISNGDAAAISTYMDANVELNLLGKQDLYNKSQATQALNDFFSKNKPRNFNSGHVGSSKGNNSHYITGDLTTSGGNFRVYLYYNTDGGDKLVIKEIRIEKN